MTNLTQLRQDLAQAESDLYDAEEVLAAERRTPAPNQVALLTKEHDSLKAKVARLQRQIDLSQGQTR